MSDSGSESENPAIPAPTPKPHRPRTNQDWWPNQLDLQVLHQHSPRSNPMGEDFDYAEEFKTLDVDALKQDIVDVMTTSQDWWPADYGHYGPLFIRMTWHAAGTYRIDDGRGGGGEGAQRFAPLNSWPDNASLDKARRLLWPVKQKYGRKISWADLLVFAGNVALESMGFKTFGFGFGRPDIWEPDEIFWGPEDTWLGDERYSGDRELAGPLGAVQMGLIYVNPEGPNGNPDPLAAARDIRETFARMAMNDEETVGAHRRRPHVRQVPRCRSTPSYVGPGARGLPRRAPGPRLDEHLRHRQGRRHDHQRPRGRLDQRPDEVGQRLPRQPVRLRVGADDEPRRRAAVDAQEPRGPGHRARRPRPVEAARPDDADDGPRAAGRPDLRADRAALPREPRPARRRVRQGVVQAAAPRHGARLALPRPVGPRAAAVAGPGPRRRSRPDRRGRHRRPQGQDPRLGAVRLPAGRPPRGRRRRRFRGTDKRGGANGARIRLAPQKDWEVNDPAELAKVLQTLEEIQQDFNGAQSGGTKVSLADLIVLGGCAAVEQAAKDAGHDVTVPFAPGRTDASQEQTDVDVVRRARADGRRVPQLPPSRREAVAGDPAAGPGQPADADRARDDGARRRHAGPERQRRAVRRTASSPTGPGR